MKSNWIAAAACAASLALPSLALAQFEQFRGKMKEGMYEYKMTMDMGQVPGLPPGMGFDSEWEVTPREVKSLLDKKEKFFFVDCRNPNEYEITKIDGAKLMPLPKIQDFGDELKEHKDEKVIVHCRSGARSMQFVQILRQNGFKDAKSMAGGILLWNKDVNPGGPQY